MKKIIYWVLAAATFTASAQMYRVVNGRVYSTDDPSVWVLFPALHVVAVFPDGNLECATYTEHTRSFAVPGIQPGNTLEESRSHREYGGTFILKNYRSYEAPAPGMDIGSVKAMLVPSTQMPPGAFEMTPVDDDEYGEAIYDVGTPYYPPVVQLTPAQAAAKRMAAESNILAFIELEATNGMPDEQRRLGERYLKGKGVPKDEAAGRMWLEAAAEQGNARASNDLAKLELTNSVTAQK
jgi:Sel1 repeat